MVRKFCCIVCLAALWATPGAWARGEALDVRGLARSAHEVLYQARKDVEEERFAQARDRILKHLESHPRHAHSSLYLVLGHAYRLERRMEEALEAYEKACGMKPSSGELRLRAARAAWDLERFGRAAEHFEKAYAPGGLKDPEWLYRAATAWRRAGEPSKAVDVLKRLLKVAEPEKPWLELVAHACLELGRKEEAERYVKELLEIAPEEAAYWRLLARLREERGALAEAAAALEVACRLDPGNGDLWKKLAGWYLDLGVPPQAARCLEKAYGPEPGPEARDLLARAWARAHRPEKALEHIRHAVESAPTPSRYMRLGELHYRQGRWKEATKALEKALHMEPGLGRAWLLLGWCRWEMEELEEARLALSRALEFSEVGEQARTALEAMK